MAILLRFSDELMLSIVAWISINEQTMASGQTPTGKIGPPFFLPGMKTAFQCFVNVVHAVRHAENSICTRICML